MAFSTERQLVLSDSTLWLQDLAWLRGPEQTVGRGDALIERGGQLLALGAEASQQGAAAGLRPRQATGCWLAPTLVDPHSVLEQPTLGRAETLASLCSAASRGGYGRLALLPWGEPRRDHPDPLLQLAAHPPADLELQLWASLCRGEDELELSPHAELLQAGALGLAGGAELPPLAVLERSLQLGEMENHPVLLAPRQRGLSGGGLVRERVEALRAGWPIDPISSEILPLSALLNLQQRYPARQLIAMNVSTAEAVAALRAAPVQPRATVHWWHLLHHSGSLHPTGPGWRIEPPLGGPGDREALRQAVAEGLIDAIAVHHQALDAEEQLLPVDQRRPGLAAHGLVLPLLWQALVEGAGWPAPQLWQALCWGPSRLLGLAEPLLEPGCRHWLLFDPTARWTWSRAAGGSQAANQPIADGTEVTGRIVATGLQPRDGWVVD